MRCAAEPDRQRDGGDHGQGGQRHRHAADIRYRHVKAAAGQQHAPCFMRGARRRQMRDQSVPEEDLEDQRDVAEDVDVGAA